jgi:2-hydroxy fatty acid dioxygenase
MWLGSYAWYEAIGTRAVTLAVGLHVVSWIFQFVGHGVFEGRKPALLDNLVQSIVLAPFFIWFHILFFVGYKPKLHHDINTAIDREIALLKQKKK